MTDTANEFSPDMAEPSIETGLEPIAANIGSLDFDKDEKRRLVAMVLAGQFYAKMIIHDADYLRVMLKNDQPLSPATVDKIVVHAMQIDAFIRTGRHHGVRLVDEEGDK
jgi:hypothetical protein